MNGREDRRDNDLFFLCSLIDYIARKTRNRRFVVVNALGKEKLQHLYDLADVYHSENIDKITDEIIGTYKLENGSFDNVASCTYTVPTHWDIGKVYKRLIREIAEHEKAPLIEVLMRVYNSPLAEKIDDYNSSLYYENPSYIYESWLAGKPADSD